MAGWTNRGKKRILEHVYRRIPMPVTFFVALVTSDVEPTQDTNTLGELTEIADGNGYVTGGYELTPNATDFDFVAEDDALDLGKIQIKDVEWLATGGPLPISGDGARYAVMTDDNAVIGDREIWHYWSLISDRSVAEDSPLRLVNLEIRLMEPV